MADPVLLADLRAVTDELAEAHEELATLLIAERLAQTDTWARLTDEGWSSVEVQRALPFHTREHTIQVWKLQGRIKALEVRFDALKFLLQHSPPLN